MSYDAFLSYSHSAGEGLAAAIELGLEELGKRWDERPLSPFFVTIPNKALPPISPVTFTLV